MANNPWHFSAHSTAQGVIVETSNSQPDSYGAPHTPRRYRLRGFSVSGSTAVAISTLVIALRYGDSSGATLTTIALCKEPGASMIGAAGLMGIEFGYAAVHSSVAHSDGGLTASIFGD